MQVPLLRHKHSLPHTFLFQAEPDPLYDQFFIINHQNFLCHTYSTLESYLQLLYFLQTDLVFDLLEGAVFDHFYLF